MSYRSQRHNMFKGVKTNQIDIISVLNVGENLNQENRISNTESILEDNS